MFNFKTLRCNYCGSVITNLPEMVINKLDGLTFQCECCNHSNKLIGSQLHRCLESEAISIFTLLDENISA